MLRVASTTVPLSKQCTFSLAQLSWCALPSGRAPPPLPPNPPKHRRTLIVPDVAEESMSQRSVMRVVTRAYGLYRAALPGLALLAFCR